MSLPSSVARVYRVASYLPVGYKGKNATKSERQSPNLGASVFNGRWLVASVINPLDDGSSRAGYILDLMSTSDAITKDGSEALK
ncbi:uncharacterized protein UV8b_02883 [Ustilaginoidea virens]|uniref:Uncharacterized protein n=1 Tax=Ustilaginoidea virens TaxID=1159556 RepID=A0A8E5HNM9_USTVR|nr:uncharacterized protein UV8b_02883 [Ustilaginoidea virens]QUC18642.1 hypothetical protein UV8b_02883 [Ustilaginoidea virens]